MDRYGSEAAKQHSDASPTVNSSTVVAASRRNASLVAATVWFAVSYAVAVLGYLAVNAIAGRLLGPEFFGYFVIAVTVSTVVGQLGLVGVHRGGLREAARLEPGDTAGLLTLRRAVRAVSLTTLPAVAVLTGLVTFILAGDLLGWTRWAVALGMALLVVLGGQQKLWANYLRGFGHIRTASLLEGRSGGALVAVCQALLIGVVWLLLPESGLPGALAAVAVGYAIPVWVARRRMDSQWQHLNARGSLIADLRAAVRRNWRFASNQVGAYLNGTVEIWLAALVLSTADLSMFSAAQRLAILLAVPLTSLQVVFAPVVSRLIGGDDRRLERLLRTGATVAAAGMSVLWIPMLVAPGPMLTAVYGAQFAPAATILMLITVGNVANVLSGMCGTVLTMSHYEGTVAAIQWAAVGVRIVLGALAALGFGAVGLAVSAGGVTAGLYLILWLVTRRRTGIRTDPTIRPNLRLLRQTSG